MAKPESIVHLRERPLRRRVSLLLLLIPSIVFALVLVVSYLFLSGLVWTR